MPFDSQAESVNVCATSITSESDFTNIESRRGRETNSSVLQLDPRSERSIHLHKADANAEVEVASDTSISDTMLARFEQTINQVRPRLLWLAQRVVGRREIAEEIVQESLLKAFRALPRFRGESRMTTWLYVIVRNATLEHLRNQRESLNYSLEDFFDGEGVSAYDPPDARISPEHHCAMVEMQTILRDELDGLGLCCKTAFQMCILDENSQTEAAAALNVSVSMIKSRVFRAKQILTARVRLRTGILPPFQNQDGNSHRSLELD